MQRITQNYPRNIEYDMSRPVLLVIDDDQFFCKQIKLLAGADFEVIECLGVDVLEGNDLLRANVLVLDLSMPKIDGIEFIKTIAEITPCPHLLIVSGCDKNIIELAKQTAQLYGLTSTEVLNKPITKEQFLEKITLFRAAEPRSQNSVSRQGQAKCTEDQISVGMRAGEFTCFYQPQVDALTNRIVGIEALARWEHPDLGLVMPGSFIEAIERSAMAPEFTLLIMESAIRDYALLREATQYEGGLSINVPPDVFSNDQFATMVVELAAQHEFPLNKLILEITEHGMESMGPETIATLTRLKMHQVQLSIDDFGVGQSGLSKLRLRIFDELKIDKTFIEDLAVSDDARLIVQSVISLSAQTGMRVVAEGVENLETLDCLSKLGCTTIQGYYFSKPLHIDLLIPWVLSNSMSEKKLSQVNSITG